MDAQIVSAIISASATVITAIISAWVAITINDRESKAKEARTGELLTRAEKKAARWLWGLVGTGIGIGLAILVVKPFLTQIFSPPPPLPTPAPVVNHQCIPSEYRSLGNQWVSPATFIPVAQGGTITLSHCPPTSSVQYTAIAVDDEVLRVEKVCGQSQKEDITNLFEKFIKPDKLLPYYRSVRIDLNVDCRIDFTIKDTLGANVGLIIEGSQP